MTVVEAEPVRELEETQTRLWLDDMVKVGLFETSGEGAYPVEGFRTLVHAHQA